MARRPGGVAGSGRQASTKKMKASSSIAVGALMNVESRPGREKFHPPPLCDYCGKPAELVTGEVVYPHRPDLRGKFFWRCRRDDAYVGCHPGTKVPMGRLANLELRQAKMLAHAHFDRRWRTAGARGKTQVFHARSREYAWLAKQLGIKSAECHIGQFDLATCLRVVQLCEAADGSAP